MTRPILVFGATGRQGGAVATALLRTRQPVRAVVRNMAARPAGALRDAGVELIEGSFTDADVIRRAMRGARGVFSVLPGDLDIEDEVRFGISIADIAAESGIAHLVYSSGGSVGETLTGIPRFDAKPRIEAHVRRLPIATTIVRPMIFMEMLVRPGSGLNHGRFTSLVRPDQPMQVIAAEDIGRIAAAIFADRDRLAGAALTIAGDRLTGNDFAAIFTEAAGHPVTYARLPDAVLAANDDLRHMASSLEDGPLAERVDLDLMRAINPDLQSFRSWLAGSGKADFIKAIEEDREHILRDV